jgi:hypothetical protein
MPGHAGPKRTSKTPSRGKKGSQEEHIQSDNERERERAKRAGNTNIDQQGNRANVRQNTTRQGNRRSA